MINKNTIFIGILSILIFSSCSRQQSSTTGWNHNDRKQGGFDVVNISEQTPGPGLIFIEGGRLTMGRVEEDVMSDWNNISKTVSVSSFYIDENEVRNVDYVEYLHWIKNYYVYADGPFFTGIDPDFGIKIYEKALPDTLVWRDKLGENEMFVNNYLRHPSYREYPVVGVSWEDAVAYCQWLSRLTNLVYRLPTEAEWEWAVRENRQCKLYSWGDEDPLNFDLYRLGWQDGGPQVVGLQPPNSFGLYNLGDNVHEWCLDWYAPNYYQISPFQNPMNKIPSSRRSSRGGSWRHHVKVSRCAARSSLNPLFKYADYGLRVVKVFS